MTAAAPRAARTRRIAKVLLLVLLAVAAIPFTLVMTLAAGNEGRR